MSVLADLPAALVLSWESSVCHLCTEGSFSTVLVFASLVIVSGVCACCLAGDSGLELGVFIRPSVY